jgi:uncharacterized protein (TIGR00106 family)
VIASLVVTPLGTDTPSVSKYVAHVLEILDKYNLKYQLTPMCTIIEGEEEIIFQAILDIKRHMFDMGIKRVVYTLKVDERTDKQLTMEGKVQSVKKYRGDA